MGRGLARTKPSDGRGADPAAGSGVWPAWQKRLVGAALAFHLAALFAGAIGSEPSSPLEQRLARFFTPYFDLADLGYSYRFYVEPPATPIAIATLHFEDGRPEQKIRIPERVVAGPPLRRQRQLALAHALLLDAQDARTTTGRSSQSRLARSFADRLCRLYPGCGQVTWQITLHQIPDRGDVIEALDTPSVGRFDLFDESLFTTPEWVGDFPCAGS